MVKRPLFNLLALSGVILALGVWLGRPTSDRVLGARLPASSLPLLESSGRFEPIAVSGLRVRLAPASNALPAPTPTRLPPITISITASASAPSYTLAILPEPTATPVLYHRGTIEITRDGQSGPPQTLDVELDDPQADWAEFGLRVDDINCDGYQDIAVQQLGGAKWVTLHWWLFDPATGKFVTSPLTQALATLRMNDYSLVR
jgi:hypothetical protein